MSYLATIQVFQQLDSTAGINGATFNFATAQLDPTGALPEVQESQEEELTDLGVNSTRWRRISKQYEPFTMTTVSDAASFDSAKGMAKQYRQAKGAIVALNLTEGGSTYSFGYVKIRDVKPQVRAGILTGNGSTASSAAVILCQWDMVLAVNP